MSECTHTCVSLCVCVCVCVCVCACVLACARTCVHACDCVGRVGAPSKILSSIHESQGWMCI